jgi:hypothetical protein
MHTLWTIDNSYVSSRLAAPPKPGGDSATIRRSLNNKLRLISRESLGKLAPRMAGRFQLTATWALFRLSF